MCFGLDFHGSAESREYHSFGPRYRGSKCTQLPPQCSNEQLASSIRTVKTLPTHDESYRTGLPREFLLGRGRSENGTRKTRRGPSYRVKHSAAFADPPERAGKYYSLPVSSPVLLSKPAHRIPYGVDIRRQRTGPVQKAQPLRKVSLNTQYCPRTSSGNQLHGAYNTINTALCLGPNSRCSSGHRIQTIRYSNTKCQPSPREARSLWGMV